MFHLLCDVQITRNKRSYTVQHQVFLAKDLQSGLDPADVYKNQYPKLMTLFSAMPIQNAVQLHILVILDAVELHSM